jgi:hypothetical protein
MTDSLTERRRAKWPARRLGVGVAVLATTGAWIIVFGLTPVPGWNWSIAERLSTSFTITWYAAHELIAWAIPLSWLQPSHNDVISPLVSGTTGQQCLARVLLAIAAGLAAAVPLVRWRHERTPRRHGTVWLDSKFPRWSEGADAITNANVAMAPSVKRTGHGLEIAPGVTLSREYEARPIVVAGDPGGGKTVAFWNLIFQLRNRRSHLHMILHDVKGDITERWPDDRAILLGPHDERSYGWAIGKDIIGEIRARELAAQLVVASEREPNWPTGAQEILVGIVLTLQRDHKTDWGWSDLKEALDLPDPELREFASKYNPAASRFLSVGNDGSFTLNAGSYVSTLLAPINRLIAPLAKAWGDLAPEYQISLRSWLDDRSPAKPVLILQRAADLPALSKAWIGAAIGLMAAHLLATRKDDNPADKKEKSCPECWFLLDEFAQIHLDLRSFLPVLETGRSLGLRVVIGLQNFGQLAGPDTSNLGAQLRQLAGTFLVFHLDPGPDAAAVAEGRLTRAAVRTWVTNEKTGKTSQSSEEIPILMQDDLAALKITRDGPQGYLIHGNAAFRLTWPFPKTPKQREGTMRASRLYE